MSATAVNPAPTPARGVARLVTFTPSTTPLRVVAPPPAEHPLADRFHTYACAVCNPGGEIGAQQFVQHVADQVAAEQLVDDVVLHAPNLTGAQRRLFDADRARLFRLLDRDAIATVLELLADMAAQEPALAEVLDTARTQPLDRPSIAEAMHSRRGGAS